MARECPEAGDNGNENQERKPRGPMVCYKCQKEGHMARNCPGEEEKMETELAGTPERRRSPRRRSASGSPGSTPRRRPPLKAEESRKPDPQIERKAPSTYEKVQPMEEERDTGKYSQNRSTIHQEGTGRPNSKPRTCFKCQQEGHLANACPNGAANNNRPQRKRQPDNSNQVIDVEADDSIVNRKNYLHNPFTDEDFEFPTGRFDWVNPYDPSAAPAIGSNNDQSNQLAVDRTNRFNDGSTFRNGNRDQNRPQRRQSPSNGSPHRGIPVIDIDNDNKIQVKQGFQPQQRQAQVSRSRSRSNEKPVRRTSPDLGY
jgi:hypothetical protein